MKPKPKPVPATEPAHDLLRHRTHPLDVFFAPESVAVIGATETAGSVGRTILSNLVGNPFGGIVYPVNPKRKSVLGIKAYPNVGAIGEQIDLAVIVTPAAAVPGVVGECAEAGVKGAIVISAGFKEIGAAGVELERQIVERARGKLRIIGPNCLGVMSPRTGLNATFAATMARPGNVGFISQSGALCTAILDWSLQEHVGFSAFVSIGSMLDVDWGDLIDYLGDDPETRTIILYMESIGSARSFLSAAREVALTKPIIVIKAGRSEAAAKAAASHTGALAGSDDVLDAAFRRSGVLRVARIADLFYMAEVLSKQPRPRGPRFTIVTNAGGPGVLAADALLEHGGEMAELSRETMGALNGLLPPQWSHNNPIDVLGDADSKRYAKAVEIAAKDPASDGLLVVLTPQAMTDPTDTAQEVSRFAKLDGKPILASWMGAVQVRDGAEILKRAGIPNFPYPDTAARTFDYMWRYSYNLRGLYETPALPSTLLSLPERSRREQSRTLAPEGDGGQAPPGAQAPDRASARRMIQSAREAGRTLLTEYESKQILEAYRIPTVATRVAESEDEASRLARETCYPVVLKLHSRTITHKSDVGGVRLSLADDAQVRAAFREIERAVRERAGLPLNHAVQGGEHFQGVTVQPMVRVEGYELILGSSLDPQFGPVLVFGAGGQLVEVLRDRALALPPLNTTLARRMMEQTRIYRALGGVRGRPPVDLAALEQLLVQFSELVIEQKWVKEIDVNPLVVSAERIIALDARFVLQEPDVKEQNLPRLAIRPYPARYAGEWQLKEGTPVALRPIRPEDEPLMVKFHQRLSEHSVYMRYFHAFGLSQRVAHERLTRICFIDYDREMALVAERRSPKGGAEILGVGRLSKTRGLNQGEFALVIVDEFHGQGLGTEILRRLIEIGREERLQRITAEILPENTAMQRVCEKLGFKLARSEDGSVVRAALELAA